MKNTSTYQKRELRKNDMEYELKDLKIKIVEQKFAKSFISKYHYSKSCPNIVLAVGEFIGMNMVNCIVFNYCCGREMAKQVLNNGSSENVIELVRMVSLEPKPKNMESYCISRALKLLKQVMPNIQVVISYADNSMGHKGYCYQASGFTYYGQSRKTKEHFLDGVRTHERVFNTRYGTSACSELKQLLGNRYEYRINKDTKSRYYKIIATNKNELKEIKKNILVESMPFPKGDNKRYNMEENGSFSMLDESNANKKTDKVVVQQLDLFDI